MCKALLRGAVLFAVAILMISAGSQGAAAGIEPTFGVGLPNPTPFGTAIDFDATVSKLGEPEATGTLTLVIDNIAIQTVTVDGNGTGFFSYAPTGGTHSFSFNYSGDSVFNAASTPPQSVIVTPKDPNSVVLSVSPMPSNVGRAVY